MLSGMVTITGEYEGDMHCSATHGPSGRKLVTDAPKDNQGKGEAFSPTDLTATSLAVCMLTIMAQVARRHGVELRGTRFEVNKHMSTDTPRRIVRLETKIWLNVRKDALPDGLLERAAATCPVHQSLHPAIEKPVVFHWQE